MIEPSCPIYREDLNFGLINSKSGAFPKSLYRILFKVSNLDAKGLAKLAASSAYSKHLIRSADFGRTCCNIPCSATSLTWTMAWMGALERAGLPGVTPSILNVFP